MPDQLETVTVHAARRDPDDSGRLSIQLDDGWHKLTHGASKTSGTASVPVRIVTTDPWGPAEATDRERAGIAEENLSAARAQMDDLIATNNRLFAELADTKAALAKSRQNFAEHVGAEFPVELEAVRVGLDVDQEIRARALGPAVDYCKGAGASHVRFLEIWDELAARIPDGSVPE